MAEHQGEYFLFGSPIQQSLSPLLHNTGFKHFGLSKIYSLCDTTDIAKVVEVINSPKTKGGSVTIPHKQAVLEHVDFLSAAAQEIGAVNTVWKVQSCFFPDAPRETLFFAQTPRQLVCSYSPAAFST